MNNNSITFYGGAGSVTGANFLLSLGTFNALIDCGLTQGGTYCDDENYKPFRYQPSSIQNLIATHAHADHIGRIPKLVKEGFRGVIYSTPATRALAEIMFSDAVHILNEEAKQKHREPLYTKEDVGKTFSLWKVLEYHKKIELGEGISFVLRDAGHILGSAMVEFSHKGKKIIFTGDLGNSPSLLLRDTEKIEDADFLVMESVYGDRRHEDRSERVELLRRAIEDISLRKGVLMIPSFAIERTQALLYLLNNFIEDGVLPRIPVFLDSPLALKVTEVYSKYTHLFNESVQQEIRRGDDIFNFPKFKSTQSTLESKAILEAPNPKIVIAGSGMSSGGRILHHEKNYLGNPKNMLLFVGYQAPGTLGRLIEDGAKEVIIGNETVKIKAEVRKIEGFSAHKDSEHLLQFVEETRETLKKVFVVMGEPRASLFLVQRIRDYLDVSAVAPEKGEQVLLSL